MPSSSPIDKNDDHENLRRQLENPSRPTIVTVVQPIDSIGLGEGGEVSAGKAYRVSLHTFGFGDAGLFEGVPGEKVAQMLKAAFVSDLSPDERLLMDGLVNRLPQEIRSGVVRVDWQRFRDIPLDFFQFQRTEDGELCAARVALDVQYFQAWLFKDGREHELFIRRSDFGIDESSGARAINYVLTAEFPGKKEVVRTSFVGLEWDDILALPLA